MNQVLCFKSHDNKMLHEYNAEIPEHGFKGKLKVMKCSHCDELLIELESPTKNFKIMNQEAIRTLMGQLTPIKS